MKSVMLLLTGIGLVLCMIAFVVLVTIFIVNDIKEHKVKMDLLRGEVFEMDARTNCERVQALEQEIDNLKNQGGEEICVFCLHNDECEPGETLCEVEYNGTRFLYICGATYKGFKSRWLKEDD